MSHQLRFRSQLNPSLSLSESFAHSESHHFHHFRRVKTWNYSYSTLHIYISIEREILLGIQRSNVPQEMSIDVALRALPPAIFVPMWIRCPWRSFHAGLDCLRFRLTARHRLSEEKKNHLYQRHASLRCGCVASYMYPQSANVDHLRFRALFRHCTFVRCCSRIFPTLYQFRPSF